MSSKVVCRRGGAAYAQNERSGRKAGAGRRSWACGGSVHNLRGRCSCMLMPTIITSSDIAAAISRCPCLLHVLLQQVRYVWPLGVQRNLHCTPCMHATCRQEAERARRSGFLIYTCIHTSSRYLDLPTFGHFAAEGEATLMTALMIDDTLTTDEIHTPAVV